MRVGSFLQAAATILPALVLSANPAGATTALFNFDAFPTSTYTPLSDTQSGITAIFTASCANQGWGVFPAVGVPGFTGNGLANNSCFGGSPEDLMIAFSEPIGDINFAFLIENTAEGTMVTASTDAGGSASASALGDGTGTLSFTGAPFTSVLLSGPGLWAIDNVVVATPVPEPTTALLLGGGIAGLMVFGRTKRGQRRSASRRAPWRAKAARLRA